jgi:hypothetical protein
MEETPELPSARVWQAQEMVSVQAMCLPHQALTLLRERARADGCSVEDVASAVISGAVSFGVATNEAIQRVVRERFSDGELFTAGMVAKAAGVSAQEATTALASFPARELVSEGRVEFRDADGELVGPAYAYRFVADG